MKKTSLLLLNVLFVHFFMHAIPFDLSINKPKQYSKFSVGVFVKTEFNKSSYKQSVLDLAYETKNPIQFAAGLHISKGINKFIFADLSSGFSTAEYQFEFPETNGEARLYKTYSGFFQNNLNVNFVLNKESFNHYLFVSTGAQLLYKIYNQNIYINQEIEQTKWPLMRFFPQIGVGVKTYFNTDSYVQPSLNFRFNPDQTLVYDRLLNQVNFGIVFGGNVMNIFKKKEQTSKEKGTVNKIIKKIK